MTNDVNKELDINEDAGSGDIGGIADDTADVPEAAAENDSVMQPAEPSAEKTSEDTSPAEEGEAAPVKTEEKKEDTSPKKPKLASRLWQFIKAHKSYIAVFFLPMAILFGAYAAFGVHPFGDMSVLVLDLNGQYVYYYENLRDALHGNGSLLNSFSRNFSGEIMGMYAYYLASPFVIIPMLLPRSMMTESLLIMQLCKVGAAAVTFMYYLTHSRKCRRGTGFVFAVMYALMGYMIVQLMNPMWLDGLIYLPLIIKGIEHIIDDKKWLPFMIPLSLMFMAHFYIGWMIAFFSIIYFLYYYFAGKKDYLFSFKGFVQAGCGFAAGGIISAFTAGWVLVPLYYSLSLGKFDFTKPSYKLETQFDFLDFFKNLLPNVYDTCRPEGSPVVYCGVLAVLLIPLFFLNERIRFREKMGLGCVLMSVLASMYLSTVDLAWHGFQVPNWLPYRYSFVFSFILLVMGALTFERLSGITFKELGFSALALILYAFYVGRQEFDGVDLVLSVWYTVLFTFAYALLLRFIRISTASRRKVLTYVMGVIITGELFGTTLATMYAINKDVVYSKYSSYNRYITLGRDTVSMVYDKDPFDESGFYRIEKNYHRTVNDALAIGSFGVSHSSSTLNAAPIQFLRKMGFSYGGHYIKYKGATYVTDALFGIKYIMDKEKNEEGIIPEDKSYDSLLLTNSDDQDIFAVYENPYALPLGFMADESVQDLEFGLDDPFENQNKLLSHIVGNKDIRYFRKIKVADTIPENAKRSTYGSHIKYVPIEKGKNCHIEFKVVAPTDDMVYFYMPSSYERKANLWLNKEFVDYYFEGGNMCIKTLGRFQPDEEFSFIVTVTEEKNEVLFKDKLFYYLDEEKFSEDIAKIAEHGLNVTYFREDHIKGNINAAKDGIMFTTISWEPGWTVWVDGVKTEPVELCDALIGVPLTAGDHEIEMKFFPAGLKIGILFSLTGIAAIILIGVLEKNGKDKKKDNTEEKAA